MRGVSAATVGSIDTIWINRWEAPADRVCRNQTRPVIGSTSASSQLVPSPADQDAASTYPFDESRAMWTASPVAHANLVRSALNLWRMPVPVTAGAVALAVRVTRPVRGS